MPVQTLWQAPSSLEGALLDSLNGDIKKPKIFLGLLGALLGTASTVCIVRRPFCQTQSCRLPCWAFCLCRAVSVVGG